MHKITSRPLTYEDFYNEDINEDDLFNLNELIRKYNEVENKDLKDVYFMEIKNKLPEGFLQRRTINTNYQQLLNIYKQRRYHRLPQWKEICNWILSLPYFKELTNLKV